MTSYRYMSDPEKCKENGGSGFNHTEIIPFYIYLLQQKPILFLYGLCIIFIVHPVLCKKKDVFIDFWNICSLVDKYKYN